MMLRAERMPRESFLTARLAGRPKSGDGWHNPLVIGYNKLEPQSGTFRKALEGMENALRSAHEIWLYCQGRYPPLN